MSRKSHAHAKPVGEAHWNAIISDHDAQLLIQFRREGYSWSWLATKFEVSVATCRAICGGHRRAVVTGISARKAWWRKD